MGANLYNAVDSGQIPVVKYLLENYPEHVEEITIITVIVYLLETNHENEDMLIYLWGYNGGVLHPKVVLMVAEKNGHLKFAEHLKGIINK